MIRTKRYVDISDFSDAAKDAYVNFAGECGVNNGEHWVWEVGEQDSVPCSYIGQEQCNVIDAELRKMGLADGENIDLLFWW